MHTAADYLRNTWYVAAWSHEITAEHGDRTGAK
jgi:hypothetical protein